MSISLTYLISRNKTNLKSFLEDNNLHSYDDVLRYCERKGCLPIDEEMYKLASPDVLEILPPAKVKVQLEDEKIKKPREKRVPNTSKTRKKRPARRTNTKVSDT